MAIPISSGAAIVVMTWPTTTQQQHDPAPVGPDQLQQQPPGLAGPAAAGPRHLGLLVLGVLAVVAAAPLHDRQRRRLLDRGRLPAPRSAGRLGAHTRASCVSVLVAVGRPEIGAPSWDSRPR